jgi:hypothetical protein
LKKRFNWRCGVDVGFEVFVKVTDDGGV